MASIFTPNEDVNKFIPTAPAPPVASVAAVNTPTLDLAKPTVGGDADLWGEMLNTNSDKLDANAATVQAALAALPFEAGTRCLFQQTTAPVGWTKVVDQHDKSLRVTNGSAGTGGSMPFSTAFSTRNITGTTDAQAQGGTVNGHVLTIAEMPSHTHDNNYRGSNLTGTIYNYPRTGINALSDPQSLGLTYTGGDQPHSHAFSPNSHSHAATVSLTLAVQYVDVIIAVKN